MRKEQLKFYSNLYKEDWYLIIIFLLMSIAIFLKSFYHESGYLSPDSGCYLSLAQNLLEGNGFYLSAPNQFGKEFFATWPVGYPYLIFITAKFTGLSVFWASKTLNALFIGLTLMILRSIFHKNTYLYGLVFLFASYIDIFAFTWSEVPFIFGLVWFSVSIYNFEKNNKKLLLISISLLFSSLFLFFSRYIGAFSIIFIGLAGVYLGLCKKIINKFIILVIISSLNFLIMCVYLYHNLIETGYITGIPRVPAPETNLYLLLNLFKTFIAELNIFSIHIDITALLALFIYIYIGFFAFKNRKEIFIPFNFKIKRDFSIPFVFGLIGFTYIVSIIIMRWTSYFDPFSFRLIAPGSFLIIIAIINFIEYQTTQKYFKIFKILLLSVTLLSWIINVSDPIIISQKRNINTYNESVELIIKRYSKINSNSIIVFGSYDAMYLFPNLIIVNPQFGESWSQFLFRVNPDNKRSIYLDNSQIINIQTNDISVIELTKKHKKNALIKLK